ncbi:MAG: DUF domain-containing protein [Pseudomonas gingeri]
MASALYTPVYGDDGKTKVTNSCNECGKAFPHKAGQSTSNLATHYKSLHASEWRAYEQRSTNDDAGSVMSATASSSLSSPLQSKRAAVRTPSTAERPAKRQLTLTQSLLHAANPHVLSNMALFFATNHIAYNVASSETFRAFIDSVRRSSVELPGREGLKTEMAALAADMRSQVLQRLRAPTTPVAIAVDGWTNVRHAKVNNVVLLSGGAAYYWCSLPNAREKNSAQWIFDAIVPVLDELLAAGVRFASFAADNEAVMNALYKKLQSRWPFLVRVPCAAHTIQLLVRQALFSARWKTVVGQVERILAGFASNKLWRANLLVAQHTSSHQYSLVKPNDTRWNSMLAACERLQKIQPAVDSVTRQEPEFWVELKALVAFLQPFKAATDVVQRDNATLVDVLVQFNMLSKHVNAMEAGSVRREMQQALADRWEVQINREGSLACGMLSLSADLASFDATAIAAAGHFIVSFGTAFLPFFKLADEKQLEGRLLAQLGQFKVRRPPFDQLDGYVEKTKAALEARWSPLDVWALYDVELAKVAQALLTMPATEAAVERTFSAQGAVHTKLRNRLCDERVQQEMFVSFNHRALSKATAASSTGGVVALDENFMEVDTEPEDEDEEEEAEQPMSEEEEEKEAADTPHADVMRTQSEINADNRAFLEDFIERHCITLDTRWGEVRRVQLDAEALNNNPGGYTTNQLIEQIKRILRGRLVQP